ncbi:phosphatase PAP2 family protein [Planctopirus hydrillae]|uniref:phosphatase PAP2 family protein n=1 Tax=Planctopirus hydrillae TaxID=1841610 RepID=UPI0013F4EEEF|nr:phosphatase PAP2 family protein [Planctopirus hydrillae]
MSESVAREVRACASEPEPMDSQKESPGPRRSSPGKKVWQQRLALLAALMAGAMLAFQWDLPVARWVHAHRALGIVREFFEAAEYYGQAFGTLLIIVTVGVLDPAKKRLLPWLLAASLGAGLTADVAKQLIERQRPRELDLANVEVTTTIRSVLPFLEGKVASHSFPSGHTATAFGLTVALSTLYRRGKTWFVILACLVGVQRVQSLSHFPSDVLAGAAIGLLVGWLITDSKLKDAC